MHPGGLGPKSPDLRIRRAAGRARALITSSVQHVYSKAGTALQRLGPCRVSQVGAQGEIFLLFTGMSYGALFYYYGSPMS